MSSIYGQPMPYSVFFNGGIAFAVQGAIAFAATDAAGNQGVYVSSFPGGGIAMIANASKEAFAWASSLKTPGSGLNQLGPLRGLGFRLLR